MCKKHTRDAEIRPFCPGVCLKSLSFLTFSGKRKNQGYFCKCLIINKNVILHLTEHGGSYENGACFYQPPGFLPIFYPQKSSILTELMGEDRKTLTIFSSLAKNSVKFFFTKGLHKGFSAAFCHCPDHYRNRRDTPCVNAKRRQDCSCHQM